MSDLLLAQPLREMGTLGPYPLGYLHWMAVVDPTDSPNKSQLVIVV